MPDENTIRHYRNRLSESGAFKRLMQAFDGQLDEQGYLAMGGQIVDATLVPASRQRNTEAGKAAVKAGKSARQISPDNSHKAAQKDTDARWTVKIGGKVGYRPDGSPLPQIATPVFGYKSHNGRYKGREIGWFLQKLADLAVFDPISSRISHLLCISQCEAQYLSKHAISCCHPDAHIEQLSERAYAPTNCQSSVASRMIARQGWHSCASDRGAGHLPSRLLFAISARTNRLQKLAVFQKGRLVRPSSHAVAYRAPPSPLGPARQCEDRSWSPIV